MTITETSGKRITLIITEIVRQENWLKFLPMELSFTSQDFDCWDLEAKGHLSSIARDCTAPSANESQYRNYSVSQGKLQGRGVSTEKIIYKKLIRR